MLGCQWFRGQQQMQFLAALQSRGARIRTLGSTVVQLVDVVMGRLDANVQQQIEPPEMTATTARTRKPGMVPVP